VWVQNAATVSSRKAIRAPPTPEDFLEVLDTYVPERAQELARAVAREEPSAGLALEVAINRAG
jgi:hypothetical protein